MASAANLEPVRGLMVGIEGTRLERAERRMLARKAVVSVILFARNYADRDQLCALTESIRDAAGRAIIIAVDQEGGRVQRFREGFTPLPPLGSLGDLYAERPREACRLARLHGWLMASEVLASGCDVSLAPVLDVRGPSQVIGDRAFHADPNAVSDLGFAYVEGMREAGMAATGKHFPGHGTVVPDTHLSDAVDARSLSDLEGNDLVPFESMTRRGIEAIMCAHVCYPCVDEAPAGFSAAWVRDVLRKRWGYQGVVMCDDLRMAAALSRGTIAERAHAAFEAGCDLALLCHPEDAREGAAALGDHSPSDGVRLSVLQGRGACRWTVLEKSDRWREAREQLATLSAPA